jgi:hypothetical protein
MRRKFRRPTPLSEYPLGYFDERYPEVRPEYDPQHWDDPADPDKPIRLVDPAVYEEDEGTF